jgi:hypothetical protein
MEETSYVSLLRCCKSFLLPVFPTALFAIFFRLVQGTSIPKANFPQQNVTAKLSNGPIFTGYLLDTLLADSQNDGCFALIEAER